MAGCAEARFDAAVNVVRSMPKKGAYQPSYETMLKFYGFYKQAKEGECFESKPGFWDVVRKAKWEAWHGLGQMSRQEAMESYVSELKQVMQTLPDGEGAAEFTEVLKSFYKLVYEDQDEQPPAILKIFEKEKVPEKIKINGKLKPNGHHVPQHENEPNGYINSHNVNGTCKEFSVKVNGFPHRDSMDIKAGFPHRDSLDLRNKTEYDINGLQFSNAVNPVLIISSDELKGCEKDNDDDDDDDDDSGIQNGLSEVPPLRPNNDDLLRPKGKSGVILTSDESEEDEFCDTLDPEHLEELQNGNHKDGEQLDLDETLQRVDSTRNSNSSSSPEHATNSTLSESENSDLESDLKSSQLLTSTPYGKHVTFAVDGNDSNTPTVVNSDLSEVEPLISEECFSEITPILENGHGSETNVVVTEYESFTPFDQAPKKPAGILKSNHTVRECGGGDASQQPSGRSHTGRTRQSQGTRNKEGSSTVSGVSRPPRGHRRRSDSDSEDELTSDHTSGPDYDSAGDRDEINERILQALERLHQDMKSVLRRLGTMEEAVVSQQQDAVSRSEEPWWKAYVPSKPLMFLIIWPFLVNIVFYYFRRRKNSQKR